MAKEMVFDPEIDLIKRDEFYLFYEMMMQSLKTDNVKNGINNSLYLLRIFLESGNIALYKENKNGTYVYKTSDSDMQPLLSSVSCIINKTTPLIQEKKIFNLNLNLSERLKNMMLLNIALVQSNWIVAVINYDESKELEFKFWDRVKDTMQIILKRAMSYEKNISAATTDLLTGLDNRNSYEMRLQELNESDENIVFGIFDLFRLKYINDVYAHEIGDIYIYIYIYSKGR